MSSKCTAAKAYDILGIYDFPDNFDALNGLHSYLYTNSDMVVEALASQKYDLARDIVTAIETVDKDGSYDDCAFYVSRDGIRILRTAEELIDALGDENGKTASTLPAKPRHLRHRGDGKSRVSLPSRLLEGRGDGGFLHRSKRRYRSRGLRPRDRGEPVAHGWRDCPRGRVLHRYQ